jgi:hypothetical protein
LIAKLGSERYVAVMNLRLRAPSLATAIGVGACVVLAASSAAAVPSVHAAISGSSIKNHSIAGAKLKNNTVTGKQIKESTLGVVPNASKLGGVSAGGFVRSSREFHFVRTMKKGQAQVTLGTFGPLTFTAQCTTDGANTLAQVFMKTSKPIVVQAAMSDITTMTASSPAVSVNKFDSALSGYSPSAPLVYTQDETFALSPTSYVDVGTNAPGSDCFFLGLLQNIGR